MNSKNQQYARLFLSWFGSGYAKKAPGTWGSLAALPFGLGIMLIDYSGWLLAGAALVLTLIGVWLCNKTLTPEDHDPSWVVLDEVAGQWIAISFLPLFGLTALYTFYYMALAFVLFRLFDILKPWPVSIPDTKMTGGLGIMLDDVLAGLMAGGLGWLIVWAFHAYV